MRYTMSRNKSSAERLIHEIKGTSGLYFQNAVHQALPKPYKSSARSSVQSSTKALPKALPMALQHLYPRSVLATQ